MKINVRTENPIIDDYEGPYAQVTRAIAEGVILSNLSYIALCREVGRPLLPLYESGIVYQNEPEGSIDEAVDIPIILKRGHGDCFHLSCWRVAELRDIGKKAEIALTWQANETVRMFHMLVRNGSQLEDPSKILGMK